MMELDELIKEGFGMCKPAKRLSTDNYQDNR